MELAWETTPHRIAVLVAVEPGPALSRKLEQDLLAELPRRATVAYGKAWQLTARSAPLELRHLMTRSLRNVSATHLVKQVSGQDKVLLLALTAQAGKVRIECREYDAVTRLWNALVTSNLAQTDRIPDQAFRALEAAFGPLARIESSEGGSATLRLRARSLLPADAQKVASGRAFRPVLVATNTLGTPSGEADLIPWTYLEVAEAETRPGDTLNCRIVTGLTGEPLPGYHPQRQRWAVGVANSNAPTQLALVSSSNPPEPLEGYDIRDEALNPAEPAEPNSSTPWQARTPRDGKVSVPPGTSAVRTIVVQHGGQVLAKFPIVPGLEESLTFAIADDGPRLAIETALNQLEDELIDRVARKEVLTARAAAAKRAGDSAAADKAAQQLRELASLERTLSALTQQQEAISLLDSPGKKQLETRLATLRKLADRLKP